MKFITLLTDFGLQDGYPGVMKGVIWGIAPEVQIADLTHFIHPQNVLEGALVLGRAAPYFPVGTIHTAVVDPGVGTQRRPIAAWLGNFYFVGPDNGLCSVLLERAQQRGEKVQIIHLDRPRYWLPEISSVFQGRDIFAPVAAHLANGVALAELGTPLNDPVCLHLPVPQPLDHGWQGEIINIDSFGNLSTNLEWKHIPEPEKVNVLIAGETINGLVRTFGDGQPGEFVAIMDSSEHLSICLVNGNASQRLQSRVGDAVVVKF